MNGDDRCDKCGAQAKGRVRSLLTLGELLFCGHHLHEFAETLDANRFRVVAEPTPEPA